MNTFKNFAQIITSIASVLLIILFVYAASSKFLDFDNFQVQLGQSPVLTAFADWVSWGIPILELLIALLFLIPKNVLLAFYASFSLMIMFTTYIILVLNFSDYIPCSCGGVLEDLSWNQHIVFNLAFVLLSLFSIYFLEINRTVKSQVE